MSKYVFNEIFKEIVDTYCIDSTILGKLIDRDSSRIRHYKIDSKPGKAVLEKLISAICESINEKDDYYINNNLMERLNYSIIEQELFTDEIRNKLLEIKNINTYVTFLLRRSLEFSIETIKTNEKLPKKINDTLENQSLISKVNQAHQYFENNLYQEAKSIYEEIIFDSKLSKLPRQSQIVFTDLGLIYRNNGISEYNLELLKTSINHLDNASKYSLENNDLFNYAVINKYLGTVYTFLFNIEDPEINLKKAARFYNNSLEVLSENNHPEEYYRVLMNYGILFMSYSYMRNSRNFLKNSISYYKKALEYYESQSNSYSIALSCANCSSSYTLLAEIYNTKENSNYAIQMAQSALEFFTIEDYPVQYAQCMLNLGFTYYTLAQYYDTIENCNNAIEYLNHTLNIFHEEHDIYNYSLAHINLSAVYILLSQNFNKHENIKKAIENIEKCKKYFKSENISIHNLELNFYHVEVLISIAEDNNDLKLLEESESILNSLLEISTKMKYDYIEAKTKYILAKLYFSYYTITCHPFYLDKALFYTNQSLKIFSINDFPLWFALTTHLVARIYNYKQAYDSSKEAYKSVLKIFTRENYPEKHILVLNEYKELLENHQNLTIL